MAAAKLEQLSTTLLHLTEPVQARLPLAQANNLANSALDFVEKRVPINTVGTAEVVQMARGPADQAASIAKAYSESLQSVRLIHAPPPSPGLPLRGTFGD